ncbi:hypothetical protein M433DRAFT_445177 [Acidomyces richmondensis BFW]|nr:hypothetical protein M433DRAFT_445177 [Acidomyces richmondensis BFW]
MRSSSQPRAAASPDALRPIPGGTGVEVGRSRSQRVGKGSGNLSVGDLSYRDGNDVQEGEGSVLSHTKSDAGRPRPSSVYLSSNLDFLRDQETNRKASPTEELLPRRGGGEDGTRHRHIGSDVEFLRSGEEEKRASLGLGGSGASKGIFGTGRLGETFKRFESGIGGGGSPSLSHSLSREAEGEDARRSLSSPSPPPQCLEDGESAVDETQDLPPDVRRELERRRLSQEERRVAAAAAEYKARGSAGVGMGGGRASAIQKRVQSLLDEGRKSSLAVTKTAEGYGRWTEREREGNVKTIDAVGTGGRREEAVGMDNFPRVTGTISKQAAVAGKPSSSGRSSQQNPSSAVTTVPQPPPPVSRPSVPPKSMALRTTGTTTKSAWPPPSPESARKPLKSGGSDGGGGGLAALLAKDLEGVPEYSSSTSLKDRELMEKGEGLGGMNGILDAEEEEDFGRRFPRLSGEGVRGGMRVKDV